jgi:2-C-methyl-D-erythritol 4-phosphate cytidylyltransferase
MKVWAIVVAGGSGSRFGGPKHAVLLGGVPLWRRCVQTLEAAGLDTVVVVGDVPGGLPGGLRRRDSVSAGLSVVPDTVEWVLVHDAARPLVSIKLVERVIEAASSATADAVIPVSRVTDTLKIVDGDTVMGTVDRSALVAVQTPQAFRTTKLKKAHLRDLDDDVTDDAGLIEREGGIVMTVPGEVTNIKITFDGDLELAEALLGRLQLE